MMVLHGVCGVCRMDLYLYVLRWLQHQSSVVVVVVVAVIVVAFPACMFGFSF